MFRTNKELELTAFEGQHPNWRSTFTLPAGTQARLVRGLDGITSDGFAVADVDLLIKLTGNTHDPHYRYVTLRPEDVDGETPEEIAEVEAIRKATRNISADHKAA